MVDRLVSVGDDFTLPPSVKATDANLPERLTPTALNATFAEQIETPGTPARAALEDSFAPVSSASLAAAPAMAKIRDNLQDVVIAVVGDSTGTDDNGTGWVRRVTNTLAANHPTHTVRYRTWSNTNFNYSAAVTVATGTGPRIIDVYNGSASGKAFDYPVGYFTQQIPVEPDLVFINHGQNEGAAVTSYIQFRDLVTRLTEYVRLYYPTAGVIVCSQNPRYDSGAVAGINTIRARYMQASVQATGVGFIDVNRAFLDTGDPQSFLLSDGLHPNTNGSQLWADTVLPFLASASGVSPATITPSSLAVPGRNLLAGGDFAGWSGTGAPTGWTLNNCTVAKNIATYESENGYSVEVTGSGTNIPNISYAAPRRLVQDGAGQWVTLAVRLWIDPIYNTINPGRLALNDSAASVTSKGSFNARGKWFWETVSRRVDPNTSFLHAAIYVDTASGSTGKILIDRAILVRGQLPRDIR